MQMMLFNSTRSPHILPLEFLFYTIINQMTQKETCDRLLTSEQHALSLHCLLLFSEFVFRIKYIDQRPVVQSIVSLTSSLRSQLVKCFTTLLLNTLKFFVEKMREAFALQKLLTFFQQKILAYLRY